MRWEREKWENVKEKERKGKKKRKGKGEVKGLSKFKLGKNQSKNTMIRVKK